MAGGLKLLKFLNAVQAMRSIDPDMTLSQLATLLTIAKDEGLSVSEIQHRVGLTRTTGSRIVRSLTNWEGDGKPGFDFIEMRADPMDYRRRIAYLNEKGRKVVKDAIKHL
ncbi:MarR family winged helix-turn-helix transcriptional regulator [Zooshikella ganghwensis]|uniref:MarR family winged helix-turn-helix transcriptional regulator n=1 Tax=Zooshikella ganghwensis TaxID=202772 RepID=UPI0004213CD8|nr:MarR family transcriptional regulator [Zooshikella ganghwensis]